MKYKRTILIVIETIIYILFMFFNDYVNSNIRFLGIVILFIYLLFEKKSKDLTLIRLAFLFTVISDLFLLVIDDFYIVGVGFFVIVQLLYLYRLKANYDNINYFILLFLLLVTFQIIGFLVLGNSYDLVIFVVLSYFSLIAYNMIVSLIFYKNNGLFALGMVLFVFCDIFVGLNNMPTYTNIGPLILSINNSSVDFAWAFYLPSQVLIALSINKRKTYI